MLRPPGSSSEARRIGLPRLRPANIAAMALAFLLVALLYSGFIAVVAVPIAAAGGASLDLRLIGAVELFLLAFYVIGLFAIPQAFWRRAFKFIALMTSYFLLGPLLSEAVAEAAMPLGLSGVGAAILAQAIGRGLALAAGYLVYRLAWPLLETLKPAFNPAA
jgi:hypothetical protein